MQSLSAIERKTLKEVRKILFNEFPIKNKSAYLRTMGVERLQELFIQVFNKGIIEGATKENLRIRKLIAKTKANL